MRDRPYVSQRRQRSSPLRRRITFDVPKEGELPIYLPQKKGERLCWPTWAPGRNLILNLTIADLVGTKFSRPSTPEIQVSHVTPQRVVTSTSKTWTPITTPAYRIITRTDDIVRRNTKAFSLNAVVDVRRRRHEIIF